MKLKKISRRRLCVIKRKIKIKFMDEREKEMKNATRIGDV